MAPRVTNKHDLAMSAQIDPGQTWMHAAKSAKAIARGVKQSPDRLHRNLLDRQATIKAEQIEQYRRNFRQATEVSDNTV